MRRETESVLAAVWYGAALASLFFYPLLQAIDGSIYYLFWQRSDTLEFALAFVLVGSLLGAAWHATGRLRGPRSRLAAALVLALVPATSFAVAIMRQMPVKETLIPLMAQRGIRWAVLGALAAVAAGAVALVPSRVLKATRVGLLLLSPVSLIVVTTFVRLAAYASGPVAFAAPAGEARAQSSIFIFVFDELSYSLMYDHGEVRPDLPNLRRLSERSTNYLSAEAPGGETITSVPGLIALRRFVDVDVAGDGIDEILADGRRVPLDLQGQDSLFGRARAQGFRTEVVGYYFPYCRLLARVADTCRSISWYNYATLGGGFSPLNPVLTNFILWPYQQPFGLLKMPVFCRFQRRVVEEAMGEALEGLESPGTRLRFVHFSVPHLPFVFDAGGYNPARDPMANTEENYQRQLQYVDRLVGELTDRIQSAGVFDGSTLVVMSDHEFRALAPESEARRIPLIVKRPGQSAREVRTDSARAEDVLRSLVEAERPSSIVGPGPS